MFVPKRKKDIQHALQELPAVQQVSNEKQVGSYTSDDIRYFFKAEARDLSCTIKMNTRAAIDLHFTSVILDVLYVFKTRNQKITIDYQNNTLNIVFRDLNQSDQFYALINFINRLKGMEIKEWHENISAMWFYANRGNEILNVHNYPPKLQEFLRGEFAMMNELLKRKTNDYGVLVEVGCGQMVNFELAIRNKIDYLGMDFDPEAIRTAQMEIDRNPEKYPNARVECLNFFEIAQHTHLFRTDKKPVFFLPFNLFGNIAPISLLLARLRQIKADLLISIYKTDDKTNEMRLAYYERCGYKNIETRKDETGYVFSSAEGLYTVAYEKNYITGLIKSFGFSVTTMESGQHGYLLHANPLSLMANTLVDHKEAAPLPKKALLDRQQPRNYFNGIQPGFLIKCLLASSTLALGYMLSCCNPKVKTSVLLTSAALSGLVLFGKPERYVTPLIIPQTSVQF